MSFIRKITRIVCGPLSRPELPRLHVVHAPVNNIVLNRFPDQQDADRARNSPLVVIRDQTGDELVYLLNEQLILDREAEFSSGYLLGVWDSYFSPNEDSRKRLEALLNAETNAGEST